MALDADTLLDRVYLKSQVSRWRNLAMLGFVIAALALFADSLNISKGIAGYIARVEITGVITDNPEREDLFQQLLTDDGVKAVIVRLDSPGGTAVGGEEIYHALKKIAAVKPVVAVMRDICTSACYMGSMGASRIFAREGTITGSIGVLVQSFEATQLIEKLGITPVIVKSTPLKGTPNPMEKYTSEQEEALQVMIDDFYRYFKKLVIKERKLNTKTAEVVADGRTFSGAQAVTLALVDEIGGERDAVEWLKSNYEGVHSGMAIRDMEPKKDMESMIERLAEGARTYVSENFIHSLDGLLSIWHPAD